MKQGFWDSVKEIIRKADVILEVLDARFPNITRIAPMEKYAHSCRKKMILVINKVDLLSNKTHKRLQQEYPDAIFLSARIGLNVPYLIRKIKESSGSEKIKVAVIGYPNTGKSSLINRLSRGSRVRTSSESGYTRGKQLIRGKAGFMLMDTPGVVPFEARDEVRLGLVSGISPHKLKDPVLVSFTLLEMFAKHNPETIKRVYDVDLAENIDEILEVLAAKWNMVLKKNIPDERRAAIKVMEDWHEGKIKL